MLIFFILYILNMEEVWKDIVGYEGLYQVSSFGNIKRLDSYVSFNGTLSLRKGRILLLNNNKGYLKCLLSKDGKVKSYQVHRIVATAFLPNPNNLPQVNHKDENPSNNFVWVNPDGSVDPERSNLEWCTAKYNVNYGTGPVRRRHKQSKGVYQIKDGQIINEFISTQEVQDKLGFYHSRIIKVCNGISKQAYGFQWKWVR